MMANKVSVYISYAREDQSLVREFEKHLSLLQREGLITVWHDHEIAPGTNWAREIDRYLSDAQIILLLISPDFMDSDYCYSVEMKRALERHKSGEAHVIPIILRPTDWEYSPLKMLSPLPRGGKAITEWPNSDGAFFGVTREIRRVAEELSFSESASAFARESALDVLIGLDLDQPADIPNSAVVPFVEASSRSFPQTSYARRIFGKLLLLAGRYEAALGSYEQALRIQPDNPYLHLGKGEALLGLKRNTEALAAYQEAIRLAPDLSAGYEGQGKAYEQLAQQTYEELRQQAQACHEKAKQLG